MPLILNSTTITKIMLGTSNVSKMMLGTVEIYSAEVSFNVTGLRIVVTPINNNHSSIEDLGIEINGTGLDIIDNLTHKTGTVTSLSALASGEYGTNAPINNSGQWNDSSWDSNQSPPTSNASTRSSSVRSGSDLQQITAFVKFTGATDVDVIKIYSSGSNLQPETIEVFNQDDQLIFTHTATRVTRTETLVLQSALLAPANTVLPAITGDEEVGDLLTVSNGTWDHSPDSYAYQWERDGVDISGATASTHTVVTADEGTDITCVVTATNATGSTLATSNTVAIDASSSSLPVNTVLPDFTVLPDSNVITVSNGTWTNSPDSYAYQWKRNGTNISGATASTYEMVTADSDEDITCAVTATNADGSATATTTLINIPRLSVSFDGLLIEITAPSWISIRDLAIEESDGVDIVPSLVSNSGNTYAQLSLGQYATDSSYDTNDSTWNNGAGLTGTADHWSSTEFSGIDIFVRFASVKEITKVRLRYRDNRALTQITLKDQNGALIKEFPIDSSNTVGDIVTLENLVAPQTAAAVNTTSPIITGDKELGDTLTCSTGAWTNSPTSYSYQWKRNGTDISGATSSTYTITLDDAEANMSCEVKARVRPFETASISEIFQLSTGFAELKIAIANTGGWFAIGDVAFMVDGVDIMAGLTSINGNSSSNFGSISAGQYTTDSGYDNNHDRWNDAAWGTPGTINHWNSSSGANMNIFVKFNPRVEVTSIKVNRSSSTWSGLTITIRDIDDNIIPTTTSISGTVGTVTFT